MAKRKHPPEWILERIEEYLAGKGSYREIAVANGISDKILKDWVHKYKEQGAEAFAARQNNKRYRKEFKTQCVEAVIRGEGSVDDIVAKNNISDRKVLRSWIKLYNANMELKDYDPKREVYMADAKRKTNLEERKEIVEYCISHGRDYKNTAALYRFHHRHHISIAQQVL